MSLTSFVLRMVSPPPEIEKCERFLFIGPHPDDIEIGAGATAAKLKAAGKTVCFLVCTDGRYGSETLSPEELVPIRRAEAQASAKRLGVSDLRFLDFCDGGFYSEEELSESIAGVIGDFAPDLVFAPDPCVLSECHTDHLRVGRAAARAAYFAPYSGVAGRMGAAPAQVKGIAYYMTARPNRYVLSSAALLKLQLSSVLDCHRSQFDDASGKALSLYLTLRSVDFGLRRLRLHAEGFRCVSALGMHCMPESDLI